MKNIGRVSKKKWPRSCGEHRHLAAIGRPNSEVRASLLVWVCNCIRGGLSFCNCVRGVYFASNIDLKIEVSFCTCRELCRCLVPFFSGAWNLKLLWDTFVELLSRPVQEYKCFTECVYMRMCAHENVRVYAGTCAACVYTHGFARIMCWYIHVCVSLLQMCERMCEVNRLIYIRACAWHMYDYTSIYGLCACTCICIHIHALPVICWWRFTHTEAELTCDNLNM